MTAPRTFIVLAGLALFTLFAGVNTSHASSSQNAEAFDYWLKARMRAETVELDNPLDDAEALTVRSVIGAKTRAWKDWEALVEVENVVALKDDYNSTTNGQTGYAVVPDPEDTEINRAQVTYSGFKDTRITVGRQRIIYDNARFVGNVGWRQNEQTFDAVTVNTTAVAGLNIRAAYIDKVRRIFGPDSPNGTTDLSAPLINVQASPVEQVKVSAYGYFLDNQDNPAASQRTVGARVAASRDLGKAKLHVLAEAATQDEYKDGGNTVGGNYTHINAALAVGRYKVEAGQETLSGNGRSAFQTPLATGHAFNGWTDQFLSTPLTGLQDRYVKFSGKFDRLKFSIVHHRFDADDQDIDYGRETGLVANLAATKRVSVGLKFSDYQADQRGTDTRKLWLYGTVSL